MTSLATDRVTTSDRRECLGVLAPLPLLLIVIADATSKRKPSVDRTMSLTSDVWGELGAINAINARHASNCVWSAICRDIIIIRTDGVLAHCIDLLP